MLILSWNVHRKSPDKLIEKIQSENPHIVTLQEITLNQTPEWASGLEKIGLRYHYASGYKGQCKDYQCLIASCWPLTPVDTRWRDCAPYPELLGRATVSISEKEEVDLFTAHIPNGVNHGWKKIDTFHVLSAQLRQAEDSPRILTGDFNEPKRFLQSGQLVTWGGEPRRPCGRSKKTSLDKDHNERRLSEWTDGVLSVLAGPSITACETPIPTSTASKSPTSSPTTPAPTLDATTIPSSRGISLLTNATTAMNGSSRNSAITRPSARDFPFTHPRQTPPMSVATNLANSSNASGAGCSSPSSSATRALANLSRSSGPIFA